MLLIPNAVLLCSARLSHALYVSWSDTLEPVSVPVRTRTTTAVVTGRAGLAKQMWIVLLIYAYIRLYTLIYAYIFIICVIYLCCSLSGSSTLLFKAVAFVGLHYRSLMASTPGNIQPRLPPPLSTLNRPCQCLCSFGVQWGAVKY